MSQCRLAGVGVLVVHSTRAWFNRSETAALCTPGASTQPITSTPGHCNGPTTLYALYQHALLQIVVCSFSVNNYYTVSGKICCCSAMLPICTKNDDLWFTRWQYRSTISRFIRLLWPLLYMSVLLLAVDVVQYTVLIARRRSSLRHPLRYVLTARVNARHAA